MSVYGELNRYCKSKFYGTIVVGKAFKPRQIYKMSNGHFVIYRGCEFRAEKYMENGKTYWRLTECVEIMNHQYIIGTSMDVKLVPPVTGCIDRLVSKKGFMEIWKEEGIVKEMLDLDNCKLYSVFDVNTLKQS